ncbi:MAG TPA: hypothetical protein VFS43_47430 [Polyangiaceae bacterium]|nr:hypothetical protein [Polyangiaceae bacterium]
MYRHPTPPAPNVDPPDELVYAAVDRGRNRGSAAAVFQLVSLPGVVGIALATLLSPEAGFAGLVGAGALSAWWWRTAPHQGGAIFRVAGGEVTLLSRNGKRERARFRMGDLAYVELDTKTIQRVQEGGGPVPDLRFVQTTVGPEVDNARIVLIVQGRMIPLTEEYLSYTDTIEWFSRIRLFLRRRGWVPADEAAPDGGEGGGRRGRRAAQKGGAAPDSAG